MEDAADQYEREVAKFGAHGGLPRQSTIQNVNEQALQGVLELEHIRVEAEARQDTIDYYSARNEQYEYRGEPIPDDALEAMTDKAYQAEIDTDRDTEAFYEAVYRVDAVLTEETRENLGQDYEDFANNKRLEEQEARDAELEAARAEAREMGGAKSTFMDKRTGEYYQTLTPNGEDNHDDFGFDER
jgi:hypothetical protein